MNIDYAQLGNDVESGLFKSRLTEELIDGFRKLDEAGEALPPPSYYATRIAEIVSSGSPEPLDSNFAWYLYQEILLACEDAYATVTGTERSEVTGNLFPDRRES